MGVNNDKIYKPRLKPGKLNKITDVPGVLVSHVTKKEGDGRTGVTAIIPRMGDLFHTKIMAASHVINGFGKSVGLMQIDELGTIETPIVMTNTLSVGTALSALTGYKVRRNEDIGRKTGTVNPVVLECNDGYINDIRGFHVTEEDVLLALESGATDFEEGAVGSGTGMICMGLKGGIGSASREIEVDGQVYIIGAIVMSNFGVPGDLVIDGDNVGEKIEACRKSMTDRQRASLIQGLCGKEDGEKPDKDTGSIVMVIGTNIPLSERQLRRVAVRSSAGLAKTGSRFGNGSGDLCVAFSTANEVPHYSDKNILDSKMFFDENLDMVFRAAVEVVEESIISSMYHAKTTKAYNGKVYYSLKEFI